MTTKYDVAIIGGGPVGIFASYFASLHGLKTVLLESLAELGGQPKHLYPEKIIRDIPLFTQINGNDLIAKLSSQLINTDVEVKTDFYVSTIAKKNNLFNINEELNAKSIIIASGAGAFEPKKLPFEIPESIDKKVHYFIKDSKYFKNKSVAVLGGGDSALDNSELVAQFAKNVTLVHRRDTFRGQENTISKLKNLDNVELLTPFLPIGFEENDSSVNLQLKSIADKSIINKEFDEIVVSYGIKSDNSFVNSWNIETEHGLVKVGNNFETSQKSIFAIGDAINYPNRVPVIALGFGEAQIVIAEIVRKLFPEKTLTVHSTSI